jgi:hypothetical protein
MQNITWTISSKTDSLWSLEMRRRAPESASVPVAIVSPADFGAVPLERPRRIPESVARSK